MILRTAITIEGKGNLPQEATQSLISDNILIDALSVPVKKSAQAQRAIAKKREASQQQIAPILTSKGAIYPARGIVHNPDGTIVLTARPNNKQRQLPDLRNCGGVGDLST